MIGEITPPRLPTKFWIPVHLPAASGPANVWVIAQTFDVKMPNDAHEAIRNPDANLVSATSAAGSINPAHNNSPVTAKVLRTRVGVPPRAIQRSEAHPPASDAKAIPQNGSERSAGLRPGAFCGITSHRPGRRPALHRSCEAAGGNVKMHPFGTQRIHGSSHNKLPNPTPINRARQP